MFTAGDSRISSVGIGQSTCVYPVVGQHRLQASEPGRPSADVSRQATCDETSHHGVNEMHLLPITVRHVDRDASDQPQEHRYRCDLAGQAPHAVRF